MTECSNATLEKEEMIGHDRIQITSEIQIKDIKKPKVMVQMRANRLMLDRHESYLSQGDVQVQIKDLLIPEDLRLE